MSKLGNENAKYGYGLLDGTGRRATQHLLSEGAFQEPGSASQEIDRKDERTCWRRAAMA